MAEGATGSVLNSAAAFGRALKVLPGGVNSPVRAFKAVGGSPLFIKEAAGCTIKDIDGNTYIDYVASYGPLIAGHAHERVVGRSVQGDWSAAQALAPRQSLKRNWRR